jgi:hypothetical protein
VEVAALESPVYIPPFRGAPKTRVGGGTRSAGANVELALLAPEHTGRTAQASPTLYWWISGAHSGEFEFVIMNRDAIEPDLRVRRQLTLAAGIHAFDLGSEDFALQPGVSYQWSVALIRDPDRRSRDIVGLATLEYDAASGDSADAGILGGLAERGLFYDAFAALEAPAPRADLLEQVALMDVARWIREAD